MDENKRPCQHENDDDFVVILPEDCYSPEDDIYDELYGEQVKQLIEEKKRNKRSGEGRS